MNRELIVGGALWEREEGRLNQIGEPRNTSWGGNARAEFWRSRSCVDKNGKVIPDSGPCVQRQGKTADCLGNNR